MTDFLHEMIVNPKVKVPPSTISGAARVLYQDAPLLPRWLQIGRPYICPFEELLPHVPLGAKILDLGCGAGLFLGFLASQKIISEGTGIDTSPAAITVAQAMTKNLFDLGFQGQLRFLRIEPSDPWPLGHFQIVSLIDVMHHIPSEAQHKTFQKAVERLEPGGRLIYKDIGARPRWRAWANQLHDLVISRQWVQPVPIKRVEEWASAEKLVLRHAAYLARLWYPHELRIWERPLRER